MSVCVCVSWSRSSQSQSQNILLEERERSLRSAHALLFLSQYSSSCSSYAFSYHLSACVHCGFVCSLFPRSFKLRPLSLLLSFFLLSFLYQFFSSFYTSCPSFTLYSTFIFLSLSPSSSLTILFLSSQTCITCTQSVCVCVCVLYIVFNRNCPALSLPFLVSAFFGGIFLLLALVSHSYVFVFCLSDEFD